MSLNEFAHPHPPLLGLRDLRRLLKSGKVPSPRSSRSYPVGGAIGRSSAGGSGGGSSSRGPSGRSPFYQYDKAQNRKKSPPRHEKQRKRKPQSPELDEQDLLYPPESPAWGRYGSRRHDRQGSGRTWKNNKKRKQYLGEIEERIIALDNQLAETLGL